jgi:hypothetical protein
MYDLSEVIHYVESNPQESMHSRDHMGKSVSLICSKGGYSIDDAKLVRSNLNFTLEDDALGSAFDLLWEALKKGK